MAEPKRRRVPNGTVGSKAPVKAVAKGSSGPVKRERSPASSSSTSEISETIIDKKPRLDAEVDADADGNEPTTPKPKSKPTPKPKSKPRSNSTRDEFDGPPSTTKSAARLPSSAKRMIAEEIINLGAGSVDVERMASVTGLTAQQVRSQLSVNRSNLRRQMIDFVRGL